MWTQRPERWVNNGVCVSAAWSNKWSVPEPRQETSVSDGDLPAQTPWPAQKGTTILGIGLKDLDFLGHDALAFREMFEFVLIINLCLSLYLQVLAVIEMWLFVLIINLWLVSLSVMKCGADWPVPQTPHFPRHEALVFEEMWQKLTCASNTTIFLTGYEGLVFQKMISVILIRSYMALVFKNVVHLII